MVISPSVPLILRNVSQTKIVEEIKKNTVYVQRIFFFENSYRLRDNVEKYGTAKNHRYQQTTTQGFASWITEATNTHS